MFIRYIFIILINRNILIFKHISIGLEIFCMCSSYYIWNIMNRFNSDLQVYGMLAPLLCFNHIVLYLWLDNQGIQRDRMFTLFTVNITHLHWWGKPQTRWPDSHYPTNQWISNYVRAELMWCFPYCLIMCHRNLQTGQKSRKMYSIQWSTYSGQWLILLSTLQRFFFC